MVAIKLSDLVTYILYYVGMSITEREAAPAAADTRTRILQRKGIRRAIRLEAAFWVQLEDCAREEGASLSLFVFDLLDRAGTGINRTAWLRTYCVQWLRHRLMRARLAATGADLAVILAACPTPCFIVTPGRQIAAYNPAFARAVLRIPVAGQMETRAEALKLTFGQPFDRSHRMLLERPDRIVVDRVGIEGPNGLSQRRVSYCLFNRNSGERSPVLAFVIDG